MYWVHVQGGMRMYWVHVQGGMCCIKAGVSEICNDSVFLERDMNALCVVDMENNQTILTSVE